MEKIFRFKKNLNGKELDISKEVWINYVNTDISMVKFVDTEFYKILKDFNGI
jgi:hypothetical protein